MNRVRELRTEIGLTQEQLAYIAGISQSGISAREHGVVKTPRLEVLGMLYLKTLPRAELDALLADPSKLED